MLVWISSEDTSGVDSEVKVIPCHVLEAVIILSSEMVEVDPMILMAVGSIAAGLAATAFCLRTTTKSERQNVPLDKIEQPAAAKPKKKSTKSAKKSSAVPAPIIPVSEESEIAAIMAGLGPDLQQKSTKKQKEVVKSAGPSAVELAAAAARRVAEIEEDARQAEIEKVEAQAEIAAALADKLLAEEEEKKNKKPKESAEQKSARLERVKIAKMKKTEEEEMSKIVAIELATAESKSAALTRTDASVAPMPADGWAVVEDKRKVKAKAVVAAVAAVAPPTSEGVTPTEPVVPADFAKTEIPVDSKKIGSIIGPKGVTLHGIQDMCGVEINTPKGERDGSAPVIVTVSGPAEGVERAIQAINDICTKGYSKLLAGEDFKEGSIDVLPT